MREIAIEFHAADVDALVECGQWNYSPADALKWWARAKPRGFPDESIHVEGFETRGEALDALIDRVEAVVNGEEAP